MSQLKTAQNRILLSTTLLSTIAMSSIVTANAQSNSTTQFNYATPLASLSAIDYTAQTDLGQDGSAQNAALNWRKPSRSFTFELPAANLTDNIELLLSANPLPGVNPRAPLTVQFNNDEPVLLDVNGQGFDARIKLDIIKARSLGNIIRVSYGAETGKDCIGPHDGGWDIDLKTSKIAIQSRAKQRALQFREIDTYLSHPGLAPRRVNLIATGENAVQLQALAAQGVGLRMSLLPEFTTQRSEKDFEIIMARRSELYQYIGDDKLIAGRGAAVIIPRGRPVKLIFTGDTEAEILAGVKSFTQRELPAARRAVTTLGEMRLQTPLKSDLVRLSGPENIADLPNAASFSNWAGDDWASGPKSLRFDVTDPKAMSGKILLRLASSQNVSADSKLRVNLNGDSLGAAMLDKRRKSVSFDIKAGMLRGKDNVLTLKPELNPNATPSCATTAGPNFHLGRGSKIILKTETPSSPTELSRMTATAAPFSDVQGAQSYITMPGSDFDFNASLKLLARLAKTSGEGLVEADYSRNVNLDRAKDKHILFIGPSDRLPVTLIQDAPRALTNALRGQVFEGDNLISANIEKFASLDPDASFKIAAQRLSQSRRIQTGGVAALYPSSQSNAHIIGIITNTPGQAFNMSTEQIVQAPYWSEIKGGVARWNNGSVLSVQAAQAVSRYNGSQKSRAANISGLNFDKQIFDNIFNGVSDISAQLWNGLNDLTHKISKRIQNLRPAENGSTSPDQAYTAQASSNKSSDKSSDKSSENISDIAAPQINGPRIKPPKIQDGNPPEASEISTKQEQLSWVNIAQDKLHAANDWANRFGAKIRNSTAKSDGHRVIEQIMNPISLFMVSLFLILLSSLIASQRNSRRRVKALIK